MHVGATGYILQFFSELAFWAKYDPVGMAPGQLAMTWMFYSYLAYVFLAVVSRFRVRTVWAVFLAGAVFGWLGEGMIVQTMYQDLPVSLAFTGLSWHALFSVLVGWYFMRKALLGERLGRVAALAAATGLVWGFWAVFWWNEPGQVVTPFRDFAAYAAASSLALIACYWICGAVRVSDTAPSRGERWTLAALALLYFGAVTVPANPLAAVILPPALALLYFGLRRNRSAESGEDLMAALARPARPAAYACVLLLPLAAIAVYGLVWALDLRVPSNIVVYYVTIVVSPILLLMSLGKIAARPRAVSALSAMVLLLAGCGAPGPKPVPSAAVAPATSGEIAAAPDSRWVKLTAPVFNGTFGFAADPAVVRDGALLRLFHTCVDPRSSLAAICQSTSRDGIAWRNVATALHDGLVLRGERGTWADTVETAAVVKRGREYLLFFSGYRDKDRGPIRVASLGLARSTDGIQFTRRRAPVLQPTAGWYDGDAMFSPTVVETANGLAMVYVGHCYTSCAHGAGAFLLGATSPDGVTWTKRARPLMQASEFRAWTRYGVAEPDLVAGPDGDYYLFVTGNLGDDEPRIIAVARSASPFGPWQRARDPIVAGTAGLFDQTGVLAPSVLIENGKVRMWYLTYRGETQASIGYAEAPWPLETPFE